MFKLEKEKTTFTPYVVIDEEARSMKLQGESFPENAARFYEEILQWVEGYCNEECPGLTFDCELIYFNSSTSKVLFNILDCLERSAKNGAKINVNWICDEDNDMMIECGEEFAEDVKYINFHIKHTTG